MYACRRTPPLQENNAIAGLRAYRRGLLRFRLSAALARWRRTVAGLLHCAITGGAQLHERLRLAVQPLAFGRVERSLSHNAEDRLGTEVVFVVEAVHHLQDVVARDAGVLDH